MAIVNGDNSANTLFGTNDDDVLSGFGDFDLLVASLGNDTLDGGADGDVVINDVRLFTNGVFVNNTDAAIDSVQAFTTDKRGFGVDMLIGLENFHGTNFDDEIHVGGLGDSYTFDRAGNDTIYASQDPNATGSHAFLAGSGNDTYFGTVNSDRIDYSDDGGDARGAITQGVVVDLGAGTATDGWSGQDSLNSIERVTGTRFADTITASDFDRNEVTGLAGDDALDGGAGSRDRLRYDDDPAAVLVDLEAGFATDGWGDTDTLAGFERIRGSNFEDTLRGDAGDNDIQGEAGDDLIEGRGGSDYLQGGQGDDTLDGGGGDSDSASYTDDPGAVLVDLAVGTAADGWGNTDVLIDIEQIDGSDFDDTLRGDDGDNFIDGRAGDDLILGFGGEFDSFRGSAGNDTLNGGTGTDRADYSRDAERGGGAGVTVDLATGVATDGFGDTDTLIDIEEVRATEFADVLTGNAERNRFEPGEGADTIDGGTAPGEGDGQGDRISYRDMENGGITAIFTSDDDGTVTEGDGTTIDQFSDIEEIEGTENFGDFLQGAGGRQSLRGRGGDDTILGGDGHDDLSGEAGNDSLVGGAGGDFLQPGAGNDTVEGGANGPTGETDELSYLFDSQDSGTTNGIAVTFTAEGSGSVIDYSGGTDIFSGIERVRGTGNADSFVGAEGGQTFMGFAGNDSFDGGTGDGMTGERDRIDYSRDDTDTGAFQGIVADFTTGSVIDTTNDIDTFTNIEQIRGSRFDDTITGDGLARRLDGDDGNDVIDSGGGADNDLEGGRGNDTILASGDNDWVGGGDGNDQITFTGIGGGVNPGLGSDTIIGGTEGFFSLNYGDIGSAVMIDVAAGRATVEGGDIDLFSNIPNVGGGDGDDTIFGDDSERQEFFTSRGNDSIDGRGGTDWLIYDDRDETGGVIVDFNDTVPGDGYTGTATGALAGTDRFINIEAVRGTSGNDLFMGSDQDYEEYQGLAGSDTIHGGGGRDRLSYTFDDNRQGGDGGIELDIETGEATDGFGHKDHFSGIEEVISSEADDTLYGDEIDNRFVALGGDDEVDGRGGSDWIYGGLGIDTLTGGTGADVFDGRLSDLDGDTITDLEFGDRIAVYDDDYTLIGADLSIVGNELRIDTTGDGVANATMLIGNGYSGEVQSEGGGVGGFQPVRFAFADAGLFTAAVEEGDVTVATTITRSGDIFSAATLVVTATGTGANPADADDLGGLFGVPILISFAAGQTEAEVQIGITEDADIEPAEDIVLTLSDATSDGPGGAEITGAETFVRILNDDDPDTVDITGEKSLEDSGELTFTVSRSGDTSEAITVDYAIRSAGGIQGAEADDLVGGLPQSGSVVLAAGVSQVTFTLDVAPDAVAELHDDVVATISARPDWPVGLTVGIAQATGSIRNDDGVPPIVPLGATGSNYGDPHLVTLDGLSYDFQAVGEFTLIAAQSGDPLNVQVRFQPVPDSAVASQTTAVATELGSARIVVDTDATSLVSVNGMAFDLDTAVGGAALGDGEIYFDGEAVTLVYGTGEQLRVDLFDGFVSTSVSIATGRDVAGLLGNADGDTSNDLALSDGTVLSQPVAFADLYGPFADSWRISDATSLFDYSPGQGTSDFTDTGFPVATLSIGDLPKEIVAEAADLVAGISDPELREAALLDYLLSGNTDFVDAAATVDESRSTPVVAADLDGAEPVSAGLGVTVSKARITEGDSGAKTLSFTIYRTGDTGTALDVGYALGGSADASDYTGGGSGSVVFEAGETTKLVILSVLGDSDVEEEETISLSIAIDSGSALLLSSVATAKIINDDVASDARDDSFATDEDTAILGADLFADNGSGADSGGSGLGVSGLTLADGTQLTVGVANDLGSGASLRVAADGKMDFDPGALYQALGAGESAEFGFSYQIGGAGGDTAGVSIFIAGVDDEPAYNPVIGTERSDFFLTGTNGGDRIESRGGFYDGMLGRGGEDLFVFGGETENGRWEIDVIRDYEVGADAVVLADGAEIASIRDGWFQVVVTFEGDGDRLYIRGDDVSADNLTIISETGLELI